jgi:hypothetical protein
MKFFPVLFLLFVVFSCSNYQQTNKLNYSFSQDTLAHNGLSIISRFYQDTLHGLICNVSNDDIRFKETEIIVTESDQNFNYDKRILNKSFPKIIYPNTCAFIYTSIHSDIKLTHTIDSIQKIKDSIIVFSDIIYENPPYEWKMIKRSLYLPVYFNEKFEVVKIDYSIDTLHIQRQVFNNEKMFLEFKTIDFE